MSDDNRLQKLNSSYSDSDSVDRGLFAEMRSNCLLYIGNHHNTQKESIFRDYIRGNQKVPTEKKLRLTKNHIGAICDRLINATVTSHSPSVIIQPRHKMEVQDKKASDIASGVWARIKTYNKLDEMVADFGFNFIVCGEVLSFSYFDQSKGEYLGEAEVQDEMGNVIGKQHKFSGEIVVKNLDPFNTLRDASTRSWETSPVIHYREMVDIEELKALANGDSDIIDKISKSSEESFVVFDSNKNEFINSSKDKALARWSFYRPCMEYPEGHYVLWTTDTIITEGSLYGVFPIARRAYSKVTSHPRGYGIIKRLRPCQGEINRIASTIANSQVYFRDRLIIQNGSKVSNGGLVGGSQVLRVTGAAPTVQQGQSGEKYLSVLDHQIAEMYNLANLQLEEEEKIPNADPMGMLYRSLKDKKKFSQKSDLFEGFLIETAQICLKLAQIYFTDEHLIPSVDKKDYINIQEFKNITELDYSIEIKANSSDIESTLGQQISVQHTLQYAQGLSAEQTAVLVANMPYLKDSAMAQEITADFRAVEDIFAAIERGEALGVMPSDNHDYFIKRINGRMKESSFRFLPPQVQQMYHQRLQEHEAIKAEQADKLTRAQAGMVPAGGALIPVSLYLDPENSSKRVRLPHDAVLWLYKKLSENGQLNADAQNLGDYSASNIAEMMGQSQPQDNQQQPQQQDTHTMFDPQPGSGASNGY